MTSNNNLVSSNFFEVEYITRHQFARMLKVSNRTIDRYHVNRIDPKRVKIGKQIFYKLTDVKVWVESKAENNACL
jgi:hypothetical protein